MTDHDAPLSPPLARALAASPYLSRLSETLAPEDPEALISEAAHATDLVALKRRFFLSWAAQSLQGAEFIRLADLQTRFADTTLARALELAWEEHRRRLKIDAPLAGLFVLGLGKLGGRDLNVSSDVDLVAVYDRATFPVPEHRGQSYEAGRILKTFTQILQPRAESDFVWRVDWRLRPEASTRGLAMEAEAARDFYFFRALPWHRLALMKARAVAGDIAAGDAFLASLEPFIWRRNLDLRALDELATIKSRINLEHPGLKAERAKEQPITDDSTHDLGGFNVKLGAGGIREIEFIANSAQLVWGGKQAALRTTNTQDALVRLGEHGHLEPGTVRRLSDIYERLRRLENAVQLRTNEHTHIVPGGDAQTDVAALFGSDLSTLSADRRFVRAEFDRTFAGENETPAVQPPDWVAELQGPVLDTVEDWQRGFTRYGLAAGSAPALAPELLWRISASGQPPADAISRIDRFLSRVARSAQYIHLLDRHPELLDPLITPLLHSPHMGDLLEQSPHIIDVFVTPETELDTRFIFARADLEARLESLRRFVNEHLYLNYYEMMAGRIAPPDLQARLTRLAETTLDATLRIVADDLGLDALPICVVGLGKLGTRKLMPQSDLDLLFLFPDGLDPDLPAAIVRRIRTVLTARTSEGIAYELDMRLRPSGRSGPAAVTLSSFADHHATRARNWEHLALSSARIVAGDAEVGKRAGEIIAHTLTRPRDAEQLRNDCARMWGRIRDQRLRESPMDVFDARLRYGGLLEVEFVGNARRLMGLNHGELGEGESGDGDLKAAEDYFSSRLVWERLLGLTGLATAPERFEDQIPDGRTQKLSASVRTLTAETFQGTDTRGEDEAVRWAE